jgi:hypothetical protein
MKKIGLLPVILLALSTIVLLVMFVLKAFDNQKQIKMLQLTQTAAAATLEAEQTLAAIPTATPLPSATFTSEPTATPTTEPTSTATPQATEQPVFVAGCDVAAFITDVTVPDGKEFDPGTKFTKTWRLINDGSCTWKANYELYFVSGDRMSGPKSQQLTAIEVPPGASIDVSVELRAPEEAGTYQGNWGIKNANGLTFGIGSGAVPFYVKIKVVNP